MNDENLECVLNSQWERVRREQFFPQLPHPKFSRDVPNGEIEWKNLQISLNPGFIACLEQKIAPSVSVYAILSHEVTHFVRYPGSFGHLLQLTRTALKCGLNEHDAIVAREYFLNLQVNTYLVCRQKNNSLVELLSFSPQKCALDRIVMNTYERLWNVRLGSRANKKERGVARRLAELPYLDSVSEYATLEAFIHIVKDYLKNASVPSSSCVGIFSAKQLSEGIASVAAEINTPGEFEKLMKHVAEELKSCARQKKCGAGLLGRIKGVVSKGAELILGPNKARLSEEEVSAGIGSGELIVAGSLYSARAERYSVVIKNPDLFTSAGLFPFSHMPFDIGDGLERVDAFSSKGILPGITQQWVYAQGKGFSHGTRIPDVFLVMDGSGSMPDPNNFFSVPVLCGTVVCNGYLNRGAAASVYVFSGEGDVVVFGPSRDKVVLHEKIRSYFGGGTVFDEVVLKEKIGSVKDVTDVAVVSDMEISNLESFISGVLALPKIHRVHLFCTNHSWGGKQLKEKFAGTKNVVFKYVFNENDVSSIVMGDMKGYGA
ncbi:hypothetical protein HY485_02990 [Candidatus Woesearchaeota archaeon]|nr:hypothetical protein [Candidatus Woesearchaeota archaeon]